MADLFFPKNSEHLIPFLDPLILLFASPVFPITQHTCAYLVEYSQPIIQSTLHFLVVDALDGDLITRGWKRLKPTWNVMSVDFLGKLLQRLNKVETMQLNTKPDYMNGLCISGGEVDPGQSEKDPIGRREQQFDEET